MSGKGVGGVTVVTAVAYIGALSSVVSSAVFVRLLIAGKSG